MFDFWTRLFDPTGFAPQSVGESWSPTLLWLHASSDLFIWLAYVSIPLILLYFTRRRDLPFTRLFVLFALFILSCGTVHLLQALALEYPIYRFLGLMKAVTAVLSWVTVVALIPIIPRVMAAVTQAAKRTDTGLHRPLTAADRPVPYRPYLVAVAAAILAVLARGAVDSIVSGQLFAIGLLAVVYVSWQHGFRPAVATLVLGLLGYKYFFIEPRYTLVVAELGSQMAVALFFFTGVACAALGESQRVAQKRAREALASAVARQEELVSEIVNRERVEEALRTSERRFKDLVESLPQLVWTCHANGECDYLSRQWVEYAGRPEGDMLGYGWADSVHPDDRERLADAWAEAVKTEGEFQVEFRIRRYDGAYRWFYTRAVLARNEYGLAEKWYGTNTDIEDRKQMEVALLSSEAYRRSVFDNTPDCVKIIDLDGRVLEMNGPGQCLMEVDDFQTVRGLDWADLWPAESGGSVRAAIEQAKTGELGRFQGFCPTAKGTPKYWDVSVAAVPGADGRPFRLVGVSRDITEQRRNEQLIRENEVRFRTLTDAVPQMVWQANPKGEATYFNRRWYEYTGQPLNSPQQSIWGDGLLHPDDAARVVATWDLAVAKQADEYTEEFRFRRADGEHRWVLSIARPLRYSSGGVDEWVGTLTDIDDQKRYAETLERTVRERTAALVELNAALTAEVQERQAAEQQVRTIAVELQRSNGELEQFAYVASHDLQEPLRKIQAFGDRLVTKCRDALPDNGKEYVDRMLTAAGRMRRLIDDLLTFARVTTQQRPFVPVDLTALVKEVVSDLDERLLQSQGTVDIGLLPGVEADPSQVRQLFQNLIANAIKFQRPGVPPAVEIRGEVVPYPPPEPNGGLVETARITVKDNGIGMDEKYLDRIFEVFQRLHGKHEYEGTGVGLAICRKIVQRHGGLITAQSRPGEGATFVIYLPLRQHRHPERPEPNGETK